MDWKKYAQRKHWHEHANVFPVMNPEEIALLAEDIKKNGLQEPIRLLDDKVLDGRNRAIACAKANVKPRVAKWQQNGIAPRDFVISQNLKRRHLSIDQRAALAAEEIPRFEAEALVRQKAGKRNLAATLQQGRAACHAAKLWHVSERYVFLVRLLEKKNPGILAKIKSGELTIADARRLNKERVDTKYPYIELWKQYGAPPFTVLDAKQGYWINQRRDWCEQFGLRDGHNEQLNGSQPQMALGDSPLAPTSVFDPFLAECVFRWFAPEHGSVLDPFAGEPQKGIVAAVLGLRYVGVDIRPAQVKANQKLAKKHKLNPVWMCGDSRSLSTLLSENEKFDLIATSPPYFNREQYSELPEDISNLKNYPDYPAFMAAYSEIFRQAVRYLKPNRFAVVNIAPVRDRKGFCPNFVGDTVSLFENLGLRLYNDMILLQSLGTDGSRVAGQFSEGRKVVAAHQNVLVFFNGDDDKAIPKELGPVKKKEINNEV